MYFLTGAEREAWSGLVEQLLAGEGPEVLALPHGCREEFAGAFCYFAGTTLAAKGRVPESLGWLRAGSELDPLPACSYHVEYIERRAGLLPPEQLNFEDPRPWEHFSGLPQLAVPRRRFIELGCRSLPRFLSPLKVMDIGCGSGVLLVSLLEELRETGCAGDVGEVLLLDPSAAMLEAARARVAAAFPGASVEAVEARLEDASGRLPDGYDIALCALSVHHMPVELKRVHIGRLAACVDNLLLYEMLSNHDTPELFSPELSFSVYQVFGSSIRFIFAQEAPGEVQRTCADSFVMPEVVSLLTEPRGERSEYHMLRDQWCRLLDELCEGRLRRLAEATCYSDEYVDQVFLHYGR